MACTDALLFSFLAFTVTIHDNAFSNCNWQPSPAIGIDYLLAAFDTSRYNDAVVDVISPIRAYGKTCLLSSRQSGLVFSHPLSFALNDAVVDLISPIRLYGKTWTLVEVVSSFYIFFLLPSISRLCFLLGSGYLSNKSKCI